MEIDFSKIPLLIGMGIGFFIVYMFLYYRFVYSVIDPLFMWVFTTAFASVLAIYVIPTFEDVAHFFGCQGALWVGFIIAYRKSNFSHNDLIKEKNDFHFSDQSLLRWVAYTLLVVYIISNLIIGYVKGFALLSDAPSEAKIANFQQGFGLFRKINWSTGTFVSNALVFMYLTKKRKLDLIFFIIVVFFHAVDGSKAALLQVAFTVGFVFYHPAFSNMQNSLKKFQRFMPLIFAGVMAIFFTVLIKENDGIDETFIAFVRRLLYTGDSLLYFYTPINIAYFQSYSFWDYFPRLVNPILGFLRIQPYMEALGNTMYDNLRPPNVVVTSVTVGPNAPFYMEGRIYFYYWGAFFYSLFVGYLYAAIRVYYFSITNTSAFYFVYLGTFLHFASALIIDVNLAITQSFDLFFFVTPPFVLLSLVLTGKLSIKLSTKFFKRKNVVLKFLE